MSAWLWILSAQHYSIGILLYRKAALLMHYLHDKSINFSVRSLIFWEISSWSVSALCFIQINLSFSHINFFSFLPNGNPYILVLIKPVKTLLLKVSYLCRGILHFKHCASWQHWLTDLCWMILGKELPGQSFLVVGWWD